MPYFRLFILVAVMAEMILLQPLFAQEETPSKTVEEKVDDLDQKVRILERRFELQQDGAAEKAKGGAAVNAGKDGFFLKSADNDFVLRVGGYLQVDGRFFLHDENKSERDLFLLRRVRPIVEGTVAKYYKFRIMTDFGSSAGTATASVQDAYVDIAYWSEAQLQVGKFKPPFGLERLQSGANLLFIERGFPTSLVPNRDVGAQLHADLWDGAFSYGVGIFNGVVDGGSGDGDVNDNKTYIARIFARPFKGTDIEPLKGLGIGIAGSYGREFVNPTTPNLPTYKSIGQATFFSYRAAVAATQTAPAVPAVIAEGSLNRYSPQAYYYWGPFGLLAEYVASSQEVTLNAPTGARSANLKNTAEQVAVSYVVTGGAASYKGVVPKRSFDPRNGQWGEVELKARLNRLTVDSDAFPVYADITRSAKAAKEWAVGINWYLNKNVKVMIDLENTAFEGGGGGTAAHPLDRQREKAIMERFQVAF